MHFFTACLVEIKVSKGNVENGKGMIGCGSGWGYRGGWLGREGKGNGKRKNMFFSAGRAVYVYLFQGNLPEGATV